MKQLLMQIAILSAPMVFALLVGSAFMLSHPDELVFDLAPTALLLSVYMRGVPEQQDA